EAIAFPDGRRLVRGRYRVEVHLVQEIRPIVRRLLDDGTPRRVVEETGPVLAEVDDDARQERQVAILIVHHDGHHFGTRIWGVEHELQLVAFVDAVAVGEDRHLDLDGARGALEADRLARPGRADAARQVEIESRMRAGQRRGGGKG